MRATGTRRGGLYVRSTNGLFHQCHHPVGRMSSYLSKNFSCCTLLSRLLGTRLQRSFSYCLSFVLCYCIMSSCFCVSFIHRFRVNFLTITLYWEIVVLLQNVQAAQRHRARDTDNALTVYTATALAPVRYITRLSFFTSAIEFLNSPPLSLL